LRRLWSEGDIVTYGTRALVAYGTTKARGSKYGSDSGLVTYGTTIVVAYGTTRAMMAYGTTRAMRYGYQVMRHVTPRVVAYNTTCSR
jgi:hypothetical protein